MGDGSGRPAAIRFTTPAAERAVLLDPSLRFGEAYATEVSWSSRARSRTYLRSCSVSTATAAFRRGRDCEASPAISRAASGNSIRARARGNVAHHYDLDGQLYALFLDGDRQYSCAYFEAADQSLDDAQLAKKRHLAAKLLMSPDRRVLDVGCGWAGSRSIWASFATPASPASPFRSISRARARAGRRERAVRQGRISSAGLP